VIDAEEQPLGRLLPPRVALAGWKPDELERVAVGIAEVERADAARVRVPVRKALRLRRHVRDALVVEPLVGPVHVPDDDRHVLEPPVVAVRIGGCGAAPRRQVLRELDVLAAESEADDAHPDREYVAQLLVRVAGDLHVAHGHEAEDAREEVERPVHVRHRDPDRIDGSNARLSGPCARREQKAREHVRERLHPSRSRR
jgi:hypothetical protein